VPISPQLNAAVGRSDFSEKASIGVNPRGQFPYGNFPLSLASFANGVDQSEKFVELWVT
jgi:hypothetical protein